MMEFPWQIFVFLAGILAAWSLFILAALKWMLDQRLGDQTTLIRQAIDGSKQNERDLAVLREELARDYIRREDWVRTMAVMDGKMDQWAAIFDRRTEEMRKMLYEQRR